MIRIETGIHFALARLELGQQRRQHVATDAAQRSQMTVRDSCTDVVLLTQLLLDFLLAVHVHLQLVLQLNNLPKSVRRARERIPTLVSALAAAVAACAASS